ncbi:MAG: T9SS type A sorting domain-containing protein [Candidatus Kapabacteria bacterium]|nr:T9SS type A sorting domain-containing protein [Candidatus Kapabacteria bacterium]
MKSPSIFNDLCYMDSSPSAQNDRFLEPRRQESRFNMSLLRRQESETCNFKLLGECVLSTPALRATPQEGNFRIDISNLPSGIHYVRLGDWVERFVKIE